MNSLKIAIAFKIISMTRSSYDTVSISLCQSNHLNRVIQNYCKYFITIWPHSLSKKPMHSHSQCTKWRGPTPLPVCVIFTKTLLRRNCSYAIWRRPNSWFFLSWQAGRKNETRAPVTGSSECFNYFISSLSHFIYIGALYWQLL